MRVKHTRQKKRAAIKNPEEVSDDEAGQVEILILRFLKI